MNEHTPKMSGEKNVGARGTIGVVKCKKNCHLPSFLFIPTGKKHSPKTGRGAFVPPRPQFRTFTDTFNNLMSSHNQRQKTADVIVSCKEER